MVIKLIINNSKITKCNNSSLDKQIYYRWKYKNKSIDNTILDKYNIYYLLILEY